MAQERKGAVTMRGNPLTLVGPELAPGQKAPDFTALDPKLSEVTLGDTRGKTRIFSVVPSLDTLGGDVAIYTVSADLPFAANRWCGAAGVDKVQCLSDHRDMAFGSAWGTQVKELRLDSRAVFVVDPNDQIVHAEYVKEISDHPDYDAALAAAKKAAGK